MHNSPPPILLVEDSEDDVFFMQRAFKAAAIPNPLHVAADGADALEYLQNQNGHRDGAAAPRPSLILLDLKLPRLRGLDVLKWIRERKELATIPVVILTSSNQEEDIAAAYALGANSFLTKPPDAARLARMMGSLKAYWLDHDQFYLTGSYGVATRTGGHEQGRLTMNNPSADDGDIAGSEPLTR